MSQALFWHVKVIKLDPCPPKSALLGPFSKLKIILFIYLVSKMEGYSWNKVFILFCLPGTHTGQVVWNTPFIVVSVWASSWFREVLAPGLYCASLVLASASTRYCVSLLSNSVYWSSAQEIGRKKAGHLKNPFDGGQCDGSLGRRKCKLINRNVVHVCM